MAELPALSHPAALNLRQVCDLGAVRATAEAVRQFLTELGCASGAMDDLELVLVEACNNAIKYAPPAARAEPLVVECLCDGLMVELRIQDHTPGFDWPEKAALPASDSEGGRGIFLMSSLMDEANYFRARGENILVLRKKLNPDSPAPASTRREQVVDELVEELSSCYESLSAIFRYSATGRSSGELPDFARRLLTDLQQITGADWFVLRLRSRQEARLEWFVASETVPPMAALALPETSPTNLSAEIVAALSRQDVWFDPTHPLRGDDPLATFAPGAQGLVHPIFTGGELVGTLTLGKQAHAPAERPQRLAFTAGQTNVVSTFSEFLAIQVLNHRMQEEQVTRRLVEHELSIASQIQQSLLPRELPRLSGVQLAAGCRSAQQVGGDFYDVLRVSEHEVLLVIADVMGKGVPAAMFAAMLRTLVRASPELCRQPAALLARINGLLFHELSGVDMFITAQLAAFDTRTGRLAVAGAGHCPLLIKPGMDSAVQLISPQGMPLGVQANTRFAEEILESTEGARVLLYTDGLTEAMNPQGEQFGQERLVKWFHAATPAGDTAESLKDSLTRMLRSFQANLILSDDQTFLILTRQATRL